MDLKRNDSVMHVVFLHGRTGLIVTANAALGLRNKSPFYIRWCTVCASFWESWLGFSIC